VLTDTYDEVLNAVCDWSSQSPKYNEGETLNMWRGGFDEITEGKTSYTIATLHYYAKLHSAGVYAEFIKQRHRSTLRYSRKDPYCWFDFMTQYKGSHWPSRDAMIKAVIKDAGRVIALIQVSGGQYMQKINCGGRAYTWIEKLGKGDITLTYDETVQNSKTKQSEKIVQRCKLSSFLDDYINQYAEAGCDFSETPNKRMFNTYDGFCATKLPTGCDLELISGLLSFIYKTVCCSNQEVYDYLINLLALVVEKPAEPVGVVLVMHGIQGTGKDTFVNFLVKYIFGEHLCCSLTGIDEATTHFNANHQGKKLFHIDEACSTKETFKVQYDKMKKLTTATRCRYEPKNVDPYDADCAAFYIITTNHEYSLHIEGSDRRYFALTMDPSKVSDVKYYEQFRAQNNNQDVGNNFYTYLLGYQTSKALLKKIPETDLRIALMEMSANSSIKFVRYITNEVGPEHDEHIIYKNTTISTMRMYELYRSWCLARGLNSNSQIVFDREFKEFYAKKRTAKGMFYNTLEYLKV
jgi:hypothetical protein